MSDLQELYNQQISDHGKSPRNFRKMEGADRTAVGYNPFCGDRLTIYLKLEGDTIQDVSFQGDGCQICTASTSMMTGSLKGRSLPEAEELFGRFHSMLTGDSDKDADAAELGKLAVFSGVCKYPVRIKCATLPWHTFQAALQGQDEPVTTE